MTGSLEDRLASELLGVAGVVEFPSQFAGSTAFWIDGREFCHFHGGNAEIRLTRKLIAANRARLKADPGVTLGSADWISVRLKPDLSLPLELARLAIAANRLKPGERPRRMPDERSLARRQRSHGRAPG